MFAWFFEIFGVIFGAANSITITLGDNPELWPAEWWKYLAAVPLIALAMSELLRIPLAKAFNLPRRFWLRAIAMTAFIGLWGVGIENWTFGIERMVAQRLKPAEAIHLELRRAEQQIVDISNGRQREAAELKTSQTALAQLEVNTEAALKRNAEAVDKENKAHAQNSADIYKRGMSTDRNIRIIEPQSKAEQERHNAVSANLTNEAKELTLALAEAKKRVEAQAREARQVEGPTLTQLERNRDEVKQRLANEVKDNSIHRIAAAWFNVPSEQLSEEQLAKAKNFFSLFGAIIISGIAGAIALVYYAPEGKPWVMRYLRGFIARKRKGVVRTEIKEVEKKVIVTKLVAEKEVPVLIKETTVKIVPVRGLTETQQPFTVIDKVTGPEAEAKLRVVKGE